MTPIVTQPGHAGLAIGEPGIGKIGGGRVEQRDIEMARSTYGRADISLLDQFDLPPHRWHMLDEGIDHADALGGPPGVVDRLGGGPIWRMR